MKVYRLESDTSYRVLCCGEESPLTDKAEFEFVRQFWQGRRLNLSPPPLRFSTLEEDLESEDDEVARARFENGISDCPFYSAAVLFFSDRARRGLTRFVEGAGELLRVPIGTAGSFYAFNCTNTLDALDVDASTIEYYSHGRPREITRYSFHRKVIEQHYVFRMEWPPPFAIYVTEPVVEEIVRVNLTGIVARLLN